jgi:hypothetical protein
LGVGEWGKGFGRGNEKEGVIGERKRTEGSGIRGTYGEEQEIGMELVEEEEKVSDEEKEGGGVEKKDGDGKVENGENKKR